MYPFYSLQVYDYVQSKWVPVAYPPSGNVPHYYDDTIRPAFECLVASTKIASPNQKPIGYRVMWGGTPVDTWTNGKV